MYPAPSPCLLVEAETNKLWYHGEQFRKCFRENFKEAWLWEFIKFGVGILELETAYKLPHEVI